MDANFEPDSSPDNAVQYSKSKTSAKYKKDFKVNQGDEVTEGYYSKSKQLPMHTDISILDASAINDAGQVSSIITDNDEERRYSHQNNMNPLSTPADDFYRPKTYYDTLSLKVKVALGFLLFTVFMLCVGLGIQAGKHYNVASRLKQFADDEDFLFEFNQFR